jgi:hypothetical protein
MNPQPNAGSPIEGADITNTQKLEPEKILCQHCKRTAKNGIKCQGICVADSDY